MTLSHAHTHTRAEGYTYIFKPVMFTPGSVCKSEVKVWYFL